MTQTNQSYYITKNTRGNELLLNYIKDLGTPLTPLYNKRNITVTHEEISEIFKIYDKLKNHAKLYFPDMRNTNSIPMLQKQA